MNPSKIMYVVAICFLLLLLLMIAIYIFMASVYMGKCFVVFITLSFYAVSVLETNSFLPWK